MIKEFTFIHVIVAAQIHLIEVINLFLFILLLLFIFFLIIDWVQIRAIFTIFEVVNDHYSALNQGP